MNSNSHFKIAVIDSVPRIHWDDDEGITDAEKFIDLLAPQNERLKFDIFYASENEFPEAVNDYDGYMLTGSPCSVHDDFAWIARLSQFIVDADKADKRIIASCFAHQLIAKIFGGAVNKNEQGWMIGNYPLAITRQFPWMQPQSASSGLYHFNKERVTRLPAGAISFADSESYTDYGYTLGNNILCIQGHPEQPLRAMNNFLVACKAEIPEVEYQRARKMTDSGQPDADIWAQWMARFFLN